MNEYAQTYPQLMNQALAAETSSGDLHRLRQGHEFAQRLSDGIYRAPGIPLLAHLTRTASILLSERQPISIVLAGLLHAVYIAHLFDGSHRKRPRPSHRNVVRAAFGEDVERLIWEYNVVPWYETEEVNRHIANLAKTSEPVRRILTIRLANDLEDCLDGALGYSSTERRERRSDAYFESRISLARQLSLPGIAAGLADSHKQYAALSLPNEVVHERGSAYEMPVRRFWQASLPERVLVGAYRRLKAIRNGLRTD